MVRDPQMSDLRVQCSGLDVQIGREFCLIFQVQILEMGLRMVVNCYSMVQTETLETGVVILHIENKSAPWHGRKIINLPQNRVMNFQKFPYF